MSPEVVSYLAPSIIALAGVAVFFLLSRRESRKTAALVEDIQKQLRQQSEELDRSILDLSSGSSEVPLSPDIEEKAEGLVRGAFELLDQHSKALAGELADFNENQRRVKERIDRGARQTQGGIV